MDKVIQLLTTTWWGITLLCLITLVVCVIISAFLYRRAFKRLYDIIFSGIGIIILSPVFLILMIIGAIKMKGNPFFTQLRPGKNGKIFRLIKFRTMTNKKDENGILLSDEDRLTKYGKILRSTSLDELPELFNIFVGDMSIIGPRPLLVRYLPLYDENQRHRHDVRPGLTGWAQVNGRNTVSWKERFDLDVFYVNNISLKFDIKIFFMTVSAVFKRKGINSETHATMEEFLGN